MMTRRALWWVVAAIVLLLGLAGLVVLAKLFARESIHGSDDWAGVLSLLLAYLAAMATLLVWIGRQVRSSTGVTVDESLVVRLRRAVRVQWSMELGTRQVQQPRPLRLRLRPTQRPVAVAASFLPNGSGQRTAALDGSLVLDDDDSRPSARALVDAFRDDLRRQMVILGEPGAGKSTLAMLFTLAALDAAEPNDAVPVLLSVAGWDPVERVEQWVVRRIQEDYPGLTGRGGMGRAAVARLVEDHLILPVLDGLDEMPGQLLEAAIGELDRAAGVGLRMVLTCRSSEFEQAVTQAGALSRAAVVDIEPVRIDDVEMFLIQREVAGSSRWEPVLESMRRDPGGPVASALSIPLMIALARRAYQQPTTEPQRLAEFATVETVQRHLLDEFLTAVYPVPAEAAKARRWLAFLARHLRDRIRDPNLRWWHLARAVPGSTTTAVMSAVVMIVGALTGLGVAAVAGASDSAVAGLVYGSITGLCLGMLCGLHAGRMAHARSRSARRGAVWATAGAALRDLGTLVMTILAIICAATALVLLGMYPVAEHRAIELNGVVTVWVGTLRSGSGLVGIVLPLLAAGLLVVTVIHGLGAGRVGEPRRGTPRLIKLLPSLATGVAVGLVIVVPLSLMYPNLFYALIVAVLAGTAIGLGRWISAPVVEQTATSPESVLRSDRRALFLTVGTVAVGAAAAMVGTVWALDSWHTGWWPLPAVVLVSNAVVVLFGSGAPWLSYTITRLWLALWGQLPWRLSRFLRRAHTAGVLRQAGSAYQFRHDMLRAYLADHGPPTRRCGLIVQPSDPTPRRPVLRRWSWWRRLAGIGIAVSLLVVTTGFIVPNPLRASSSWMSTGWMFSVAFSIDGTLASGSTDGTVRLWDANTDRPLRTISANPMIGNAFGVALSQDGSMLAAAPRDQGIVRLWDPATGNLRRTLAADSDTEDFVSLAFSPDGLTLAAAGQGAVVWLWDPATGQLRRTLTAGTSWVSSLAFSPDGSILASASDDRIVRLWDPATGQLRRTFTSGADWRDSLAFSPNGSTLAGIDDGVARLWDPATGQLRRTLTADGGITSLAFSPDGSTLATGEGDGHVRLRDSASGRPRYTFIADTGSVDSVAFNPNESTLASAGDDGVIRLWNVAMLERRQP